MAWLDRELQAGPYIAGERYSVADIAALTSIDFARFIGLEVPESCVQLRAWHARVSERTSAGA
jgi:glutathione S-transferase